jgi:hypothetical protein
LGLEAADPTRSFFEQTERTLGDGTLVLALGQAVEEQRLRAIQELGPLARWRAQRAEAAAAKERYAARETELTQMRPEIMGRGAMAVRDLRPEDHIALSMETYPSDTSKASCTIWGIVQGFEIVAEGENAGSISGVVVTVESDSRTNPQVFTLDKLPSDARVVLNGTALSSDNYIRDPGKILASQMPVFFWGGRQCLSSQSCPMMLPVPEACS